MHFEIAALEKILGARTVARGEGAVVASVSIDSRTIKAGDLYVAIKGAHFDGNDFVADALAKGAIGAVVDRDVAAPEGKWCFRVNDSVAALGALASQWRSTLKTPCIAITGSNGKSTTKEMVAAVASQKGKVVKTEGNLNNLIGCPLTLLRWDASCDIAVIEMGMNAPGEIDSLARITNPDIGIITNVNPAHLELLHSVENVAKAKGELFRAMRKDGVVIVNREDPWVTKLGNEYPGKQITFGMLNGVDVQFGHMISQDLADMELTCMVQGKEYSLKLPVAGTHNVMNALCAIATGLALGVKVEDAARSLTGFKPMKMRMERVVLANGVHVVNDTYNANPGSMKAALRTVGGFHRAGRFIAVLGDMFELGDASASLHSEVGTNAAKNGVDALFVLGSFAGDVASGATSGGVKKVMRFADVGELTSELSKMLQPGDVVLVKGSRGMKMERVVDFLKYEFGI